MNLLRVASIAALALIPGFTSAQASAETQAGAAVQGPSGQAKIAVIDIEFIAQESNEGKALFEQLRIENDKMNEQGQQLQQEIADMQTKLNSEILSQDAKMRLQRDIERKRTDAQRWAEDAQAEFEAKRQDGEAKFQEKLAPIVEQVAKENGIGLIFRATPGLTIVYDPTLDISNLVVEKLNAATSTGEGAANPQ